MKVLALNNQGLLTYCSVPEDERGKGRCNHLYHANDGESTQEFIERLNKTENKLEQSKVVEISGELKGFARTIKDPRTKSKLFKRTLNGYKMTPYGEYIVYSQAKLIFAAKIVELDKGNEYHVESTAEEYDKKLYYEERGKYKQDLEKLDKYMENYKLENPDEFMTIDVVESPAHWIKNYECKTEFTLDEAIQGYKYASEKLNNVDKSKLPVIKQVRVKPEFREKVSGIRESKRELLGIPSEDYFKSLGKVTVNKTRLALNRKKADTKEPNKKFMQDMVGYLAEF